MTRWLTPLRGSLNVFSRWSRPQAPRRGPTSDPLLSRLQLAQRIAWLAILGLGLYTIADLFIFQRRLPTAVQPSAGGPDDSAGGATVQEGRLKTLAAYRDLLVSRNPFNLKSADDSGGSANQWVKQKMAEMAGSLSVVGISRGKNPEALIEDTNTHRTYFAKIGDEVNGLKVKAIDDRGVVVSYENEELVLP
jgi:hypothetical protein